MSEDRPFNGDRITQEEFSRLAILSQATVAIETGTEHGRTTQWLAQMIPEVHTIELDTCLHTVAAERFMHLSHVHCHHGASHIVLANLLIPLRNKGKRPIIYLDAHHYNTCPLQDELRVIGSHMPDQCVIVIDDFEVPGQPHYTHNDNFDITHLHQSLDLAFPAGYTYYYIGRSLSPDGASTGRLHVLPASMTIPSGWIIWQDGEPYSAL
jgi:predicted O-methyltransferase YrrM